MFNIFSITDRDYSVFICEFGWKNIIILRSMDDLYNKNFSSNAETKQSIKTNCRKTALAFFPTEFKFVQKLT